MMSAMRDYVEPSKKIREIRTINLGKTRNRSWLLLWLLNKL